MNPLHLFAAVALLLCAGPSALFAQTPPAGSTPVGRATDTVFYDEPEMPRFDNEVLARLIGYPDEARVAGISGLVVVSFVVDTTGRTEKLEIIESPSPLLSEAALEAIRKLPFIPARQFGKPVRVRMTIPIDFTLAED